MGRHLTLDDDMGVAVVDDAVVSVRRYFWSLTLSAVVTAVLIGGTAWVLDVPLAFTIAIITLVTSYVPYLGAIISGAFATIIALGSAGLGAAIIMLVVILVVQNIVQTIVLARLASTALSLHPIVVLGATIVGAALAGVLGASLAAPAVAVGVQVQRRLSGGGSTDPRVVRRRARARSGVAPRGAHRLRRVGPAEQHRVEQQRVHLVQRHPLAPAVRRAARPRRTPRRPARGAGSRRARASPGPPRGVRRARPGRSARRRMPST